MLNPFPHLFEFSFFAPTLLRVAVAVLFAYHAQHTFKTHSTFANTRLPIIGKPGIVLVYVITIAYTILAAMLFFGWYTQIAAIVGGIAMLKHAWFAREYKLYSPLSRSAYLLAAVMCISLLVTGAGALAMDLPL
ncbi:MAG TPA: DoxX family membrane protein [Candidatus Paceibacterota bacterium]|nr:DoxX family membrane protein [Candidatus Paceibacterota bacterium]